MPFCTLPSLDHCFDVLPDLVALLSKKPRLGSGVKPDPGFAWKAQSYFSLLMHQRCLGQDFFICNYVSYYFFFYFKNDLLNQRKSCCLVHIFDFLLAKYFLLPKARTKITVV